MLQNKKGLILAILSCFIAMTAYSQGDQLDVLSYSLTVEPKIQEGYIEGTVVINLKASLGEKRIVLNAGDLEVDQVTGFNVKSFRKNDSKLIVELFERKQTEQEITINYHGNPKRGLLFNPELDQAHTVYFTSHWMICNDKPSDKATLSLNILIPNDKQCIASGELIETEKKGDKTLYRWSQNYETPAYTYGFVIGTFTKITEEIDDVKLNYYASELNENDLGKVFAETPNILKFFEEKSGIRYAQSSYSQILIGSNYQEMSGLSVLSNSYAVAVLKDSSEIHLTSHELAHQWWGNMITCKNFSHFWLNEAFAVYMASAFNEHKFGREKYLADISLYKSIYDDLIKRGKDKPLVFPNWRPSRDNRNVIYYKGAYVLHLLREELGDKGFWRGINLYSQRFFGKSVETTDFKLAMEEATNADLDDFFNVWVYKKER